IVGGVERAVLEPADADIAGEARVLHLGEWLEPAEALGLLAPELVGIGQGVAVHPLVAGAVDHGMPRGRRLDLDQIGIHGGALLRGPRLSPRDSAAEPPPPSLAPAMPGERRGGAVIPDRADQG